MSREIGDARDLLEIGPGVRPTLPITRSHFVDRSEHAATLLERAGGQVHLSDGLLPFHDASMDAVAAFEIVEHLEHDDVVLGEIARVLRPGGILLLSVPIRASMWSPLDDACGHVRRYEPPELFARLADHGIDVGGYEWSPAAPAIVYRFRAWVLLRARPLVAKLGQAIVFPIVAAWDARFGHLRWHDPALPVPEEAEHLMLWARRSAPGDADPA